MIPTIEKFPFIPIVIRNNNPLQENKSSHSINPPQQIPENANYQFMPANFSEAIFAAETGWHPAKHILPEPAQCGDKYIVTGKSLSGLTKNGSIELTNAVVSIVEIERIFSDGTCQEFFILRIECEVWENAHKNIKIDKNNFKSVFSILRKEFPEIKVFSKIPDALEEYLADIVNRDYNNATIRNINKKTGWFPLDGEPTKYELGCDSFYHTSTIPILDTANIEQIFQQGFSFLEVGHNGAACTLLFIFAHIPYVLFWLREGAVDFTSILYLNGSSNLLKTATASVLANIWETNRTQAKLRLNSTKASMLNSLALLQDQLILLDDSSNSEARAQKNIEANLEIAIRTVGDGSFDAKMQNGNQEIARRTFRGAVVVTGEEHPNLGRSSILRMVEVQISEGSFDGEVLSTFQNNPELLRQYFALFVKFLENMGTEISHYAQTHIQKYRESAAKILTVRRYIDSAAGFHIVIDIIGKFANFCKQQFVFESRSQNLSKSVFEIMQQNQHIGEREQPVRRFLRTLTSILNTSKTTMIAKNELEYAAAESAFIGFFEANEIWLRPAIYQEVVKTLQGQNESFSTSFDTIKKMLLTEGYSKGKNYKDKKEYLVRAKKGSRKRMLVLYRKKIENFFEEEI